MSESDEQRIVAEYLDLRGLLWCHVPNEGKHKPQYMRQRALAGVKSGVPDVLVFQSPPKFPGQTGAAVELKRPDGSPSDVSDNQAAWLEALEANGWLVKVAYGAGDAIAWLQSIGF